MGRPTSANVCRQEIRLTYCGQVYVVSCARAEGHAGAHQGAIRWPQRVSPE